jgi:predicted dehydrogenase
MQVDRSWSSIAHLPALRAVEGYEVSAVSTTRQESADAAAAHYGIPNAFAGHEALVSSPDVDLVVVTVKVPAHFEIVSAAIQAGKHVYCEWPLGNGLEEAKQLAQTARSKGVRTMVGLQARVSPTICYVRDLVAQGYVGNVLSSSLIGTGGAWGEKTDVANAYLADRSNGATMLSIPVGHTLDAVCSVLGEMQQPSAILANGRTQATIIETGEVIPMTAHDQVALVARTENGAVLSAQYRGGSQPGTGLLWEIYGTQGTLRVTGAGGHAQIVDLSLEGSNREGSPLAPLAVPDKYFHTDVRQGPALNVAEMYHRFAQDLQQQSHTCPDFDDGVTRHAMLESIESAAFPSSF